MLQCMDTYSKSKEQIAKANAALLWLHRATLWAACIAVACVCVYIGRERSTCCDVPLKHVMLVILSGKGGKEKLLTGISGDDSAAIKVENGSHLHNFDAGLLENHLQFSKLRSRGVSFFIVAIFGDNNGKTYKKLYLVVLKLSGVWLALFFLPNRMLLYSFFFLSIQLGSAYSVGFASLA